jgi:hypothetical protein
MVAQWLGAAFLWLSFSLKCDERLSAYSFHNTVRKPSVGIVVDLVQICVDDLKLHAR